MDLPYLSNSVLEGAKWLTVVGGSGAIGLAAVSTALHLCSSKIINQEKLDRVVADESKKLGIQKPVNAFLHNKLKASAKISSNSSIQPEIHVGGLAATRNMVCHELYHIHKEHHRHLQGHSNKLARLVNYYLKAEIPAQLYGAFRIKI